MRIGESWPDATPARNKIESERKTNTGFIRLARPGFSTGREPAVFTRTAMRAWPKAVNSSPVRYRGERSARTQKPAFGEPGVPGAGIAGGGAVLGGTLVDGGGVTGGGNVPGGVVGGTLIGAPGFTGGGMEGGTGAIFGPGVRPVSGKLAFGLLVMATAGKGKLFVEVPTPVELVLDEE